MEASKLQNGYSSNNDGGSKVSNASMNLDSSRKKGKLIFFV